MRYWHSLCGNIENCGFELLLPPKQKEKQENIWRKTRNGSKTYAVPLALDNSVLNLPNAVNREN
jgi:hypothetical protein